MRSLVAALLILLAAPAAAFQDRATAVEALGALSIAPQLCGIAVDRKRLGRLAEEIAGPGDHAFRVDMFRVNDRIAREHRGWNDADRAAYCEASGVLAGKLGVLR